MQAELYMRRRLWTGFGLLLLCTIAWSTPASAQLLYTFETPELDGWTAASATLTPSTTLGVTDGTQSMLIDNLAPDFNNDTGHITHGAGSGNPFNFWDAAAMAIAAGETDVKLEFDFSWDEANVTTPAWAQLGIFVNSTGAGFTQYGTGALIGGNMGQDFPILAQPAIDDGVTMSPVGTNTVHLAIPVGPATRANDNEGLNIGGGAAGTNFYQMGFKTNGGWTGTVDWAIDNVRITGAVVPTTSETLFSWETADNTATPAVDERFEGWIPGNFDGHPPHGHSITSTGATDGANALQIDRTADQEGFSWGSLFVLNSDTNPDPNVETIDPVIQARIEELISKVEAADRVAFDVTYQYQDRFPLADPTFTILGLHFSDETGKFYQAEGDNINVVAATSPATVTIDIPLEDFVDTNDPNLTLKEDGLADDSNFFRIGLSTNTDGAQIYQVDNLRLISLLPETLPGDFNNDGAVDAADYVVWRKRNGSPEEYNEWRTNFGTTSGGPAAEGASAVPEPAVGALMIFAAVAIGLKRRGTSC